MSPLDISKLRHELAALKSALGTAKTLVFSTAAGGRLAELVILAEAKSRAILTQVDLALDHTATEQGT